MRRGLFIYQRGGGVGVVYTGPWQLSNERGVKQGCSHGMPAERVQGPCADSGGTCNVHHQRLTSNTCSHIVWRWRPKTALAARTEFALGFLVSSYRHPVLSEPRTPSLTCTLLLVCMHTCRNPPRPPIGTSMYLQ